MKMKKAAIAAVIIATLLATPQSTASADATSVATSQLGRSEHDAGFRKWLGINSPRYPWCARFIKRAHQVAGRSVASRMGDSVVSLDSGSIGPAVSKPKRGDIAFRRHSHAEIVISVKGGVVCTVSGNSTNKVSKRCGKASGFRRFRRPG